MQMFQLVQPERILYMQAKNSVDQIEWWVITFCNSISVLTDVSYSLFDQFL